jgi:CRP-like cAMP-binding protein
LRIAAARFGTPQPDGRSLVALTETQLAQQTGLARETVSRELKVLKQAGIVAVTKTGLLVAIDEAD